jgi:hypothetical protein
LDPRKTSFQSASSSATKFSMFDLRTRKNDAPFGGVSLENEGQGGRRQHPHWTAGSKAEGWKRGGEEQNVSVEALVERSGGGLARGPGKGKEMGTYLYIGSGIGSGAGVYHSTSDCGPTRGLRGMGKGKRTYQ